MALRCKPGDLAIVVKSYKGREGHIVRCVRFFGRARLSNAGMADNCWVIEWRGSSISPGGLPWMLPDDYLRPLRGDLTGDTESTDTPIRETA